MPIFRYSSLFGTSDLSLDPVKHPGWCECSGSRTGRCACAAASRGGGASLPERAVTPRGCPVAHVWWHTTSQSSTLFPRIRFPHHKSSPKLAPEGPGLLQPGNGQMGILTSPTVPIQGPGAGLGRPRWSVLGGRWLALYPFRRWLLALSPLQTWKRGRPRTASKESLRQRKGAAECGRGHQVQPSSRALGLFHLLSA